MIETYDVVCYITSSNWLWSREMISQRLYKKEEKSDRS